MDNEENVQISVENEKFSLSKKDLMTSSAFFNAMFSGRYAESRQKCINLKGKFNRCRKNDHFIVHLNFA